jgi:hypothetical protein
MGSRRGDESAQEGVGGKVGKDRELNQMILMCSERTKMVGGDVTVHGGARPTTGKIRRLGAFPDAFVSGEKAEEFCGAL